jgi:hypothetical protein
VTVTDPQEGGVCAEMKKPLGLNEVRRNYTFKIDHVTELKKIADDRSTTLKPVTISIVLEEIIGDYLAKREHPLTSAKPLIRRAT